MEQNQIPQIGMGTYPLKGQILEQAVLAAMKCGYRLFDTAHNYGNESDLGVAIQKACAKTGISRDEIWLCTKVDEDMWQGIDDGRTFFNTGAPKDIEKIVRSEVEGSLRKLQTDYLDIVLIHWPYPDYLVEIWLALEKLHQEGVIRKIGVSNARERHLKRIMENSSVVPMLNQLEISPINTKESLVEFCQSHDITVMVYSPLMSLRHKKVKESELLKKLCEKHGCSLAQLVLKWDLQRGLLPIPKSASPDRLRQNISLDFQLDASDMEQISSLNENFQYLPESIYCPGY
jgi:diketogulonate reductase-like aldo/keto reductase